VIKLCRPVQTVSERSNLDFTSSLIGGEHSICKGIDLI
jgi:hypothetical protein